MITSDAVRLLSNSRQIIYMLGNQSSFSSRSGPPLADPGLFAFRKGIHLLSRLLCCARKIVATIFRVGVDAAGRWRGSVWPSHLRKLTADPAYAAAAGAIAAGLLGLLPPAEVIAAVLTAIISVLLRDRPATGSSSRFDPRDFV